MRKTLLITLLIVATSTIFAQVDGFMQEGKASFYADKFEGRTTASGERYSHKKATCAHLSLPFGTLVKVTNMQNSKTAVVRVNDRGPFVADRIIDLSKSVAERLDFVEIGVADVKIEVINSEGDIATNHNKEKESPSSTNNITKETTKENKGVKETKIEKQKKDVTPNIVITQQTANPTETLETELFRTEIEKVESKGYSVQIGSYKELVSVLRIVDEVEKKLQEKVYIQVTGLNGERIYRIMVGNYESIKDARKFKEKASKVYSDCFVVSHKPAETTKSN